MMMDESGTMVEPWTIYGTFPLGADYGYIRRFGAHCGFVDGYLQMAT